MKKIKNKFISIIFNFLVTSTILLLINSCAYFKLKELDKHNFSNSDIYDLIAKEYKAFANFELYDMHDEFDANYFAFKAIEILKNKEIRIENPSKWNIPYNYIEEAEYEYNRLNVILENEDIYAHPKLTADLVSGYDCWIEQIEENWQTEDIDNCKLKFTKAYNSLNTQIANKKEKVEKKQKNKSDADDNSLPVNNKSNLVSEKVETKVIVYFEYDSYNISIQQIKKLDSLIKKIENHYKKTIVIYGHTDTKGPKNYNLNLSKKRASEVMKYFKTKNISNKVIIKAYGD